MDRSFFQKQLATYASYHRDPRNQLTHMIGIPAIVFSLLVPLALARLPGGTSLGVSLGVSWAMLVAALALAGWIALDRTIGLAMLIILVPMLVIAEWIAARFSTTTVWIVFGVFFVGGWIFQLVGHVWEGRRPALADNLFQAFIGPMFIMAEVLMRFGFKPELKAIVDGPAPRA